MNFQSRFPFFQGQRNPAISGEPEQLPYWDQISPTRSLGSSEIRSYANPSKVKGHRHRNASATTLRFLSLLPRCVLQRLEEQSWSGCGESGNIAGQSQHHRLQHRSSPSSPITVFTCFTHRLPPLSQFAHAARTLVRSGPTRPHRQQLVASHSTLPPLHPPPPRTAFM